MLTVKIIPNEKGLPSGKLADAELYFASDGGSGSDTDSVLHGCKLIGFAIWQTRTGQRLNVTFPARQYSVNGERRSFALLRPSGDYAGTRGPVATDAVRDLILDAWRAYERGQEQPQTPDEQAARASHTTTSGPDDRPLGF